MIMYETLKPEDRSEPRRSRQTHSVIEDEQSEPVGFFHAVGAVIFGLFAFVFIAILALQVMYWLLVIFIKVWFTIAK